MSAAPAAHAQAYSKAPSGAFFFARWFFGHHAQQMKPGSHFDFDAAVSAPFRMQPGLRKMADGAAHLTPLAPGTRHQREKLAVLSAYWHHALCAVPGFDAAPALHALCAHAAREHPKAWAWDGQRAQALLLGTAVDVDGGIHRQARGSFGLGDEITRCLQGLPAAWRLPGLLCLAFAEDFALLDGSTGTLPWLAVCLPSHWAPEAKIGQHFSAVHAPVADNALLLKASDALVQLVTGVQRDGQRWERFVWNITDQPRLHAHPARVDPQRWGRSDSQPNKQPHQAHPPHQPHQPPALPHAWLRTERQTFIPLPGLQQAVFTITVDLLPLADVAAQAERAAALHAAVSTMSDAVLAYRGLRPVRDTLLAWLAQRMHTGAAAAAAAATTTAAAVQAGV